MAALAASSAAPVLRRASQHLKHTETSLHTAELVSKCGGKKPELACTDTLGLGHSSQGASAARSHRAPREAVEWYDPRIGARTMKLPALEPAAQRK